MKKFIAPSILSADFTNLSREIRSAEMGSADFIHCDVMDGKFVPNITFGPIVVSAVRRLTKLPIDVHLMIKDPDNFIEDFVKAGADYVTVHQEEVVHLHRTVTYIKELGAKAGVALNPATPVETLTEILPFIDMVLIMSVNPGFGGQKFIETSIPKIQKLKMMREEGDYDFLIEVDGGVNVDTIASLSEAGVDVFVAGSAIFGSNNATAAAVELKNIVGA